MKPVWYTALRKFGPGSDGWASYLAWAKLPHLTEVVSLDIILCPPIIQELTVVDWQHNVQEDFKTVFFVDLDYLLSRVGDPAAANTIATIEEPELEDVESFRDGRFRFIGFDLIELPGTGVSALVNCGGFDRAFLPKDLNAYGLITDYAFARVVQRRLVEQYPGEHHAQCSLWAVWRYA